MAAQNIIDALASLLVADLGTVIHVGSGAAQVVERYRPLAPQRLVLVEGDPATAAALRLQVQAAPWAEVWTQPVTPQGGTVNWHAYNLPHLNGPLDAMALAAYYPRLRETSLRPREALPFMQLIAQQPLSGDLGREDALVLDVPGQELDLITALPQEMLARFSVIVLRSCRDPLPSGATGVQAVAALQQQGWNVVARDTRGPEPLWPVTCLRFDRSHHLLVEQLQQHAKRLEQAQAALKSRDDRISELEAALAAAGAAQGEHLQRSSDLDARLQSALRESAERAQLLAKAETRLAEAEAAVSVWQVAAARDQARVQELENTAAAQRQVFDEQLAATHAQASQRQSQAVQREAELVQRLEHAEQALTDALGSSNQSLAEAAQREVDLRQALDAAELQRAAEADEASQSLSHAVLIEAELRQQLHAASEQLASVQREAARGHEAAALREAEAARQIAAADAQQALLQTQRDEAMRSTEAANAQAAAQREALQRDLDEARQSAAIALRLQLLRHADLSNLQDRYKAAQLQLREQNELLGKVAQRLSAANQYFLQLSRDDPASAPATMTSTGHLAMDSTPGVGTEPTDGSVGRSSVHPA